MNVEQFSFNFPTNAKVMMIGKFGKYAAGQHKQISGQTSSNLSQQSMNQAKSIARWCVSVSQCV